MHCRLHMAAISLTNTTEIISIKPIPCIAVADVRTSRVCTVLLTKMRLIQTLIQVCTQDTSISIQFTHLRMPPEVATTSRILYLPSQVRPSILRLYPESHVQL